jgi:hypothetical protein
MPPRRSARVAAVTERATTALSPLPLSAVLHIFSLLPVDDRLRCAEVCRGWRAVLLERSLWTRLDVSATSGVRAPQNGRQTLDNLLRCAAARAGGGLQSLDLSVENISTVPLRHVVAANAGALHVLRMDTGAARAIASNLAEDTLRAAPALRLFSAGCVQCDDAETACRMLRNEAPFGPLRMQALSAGFAEVDEADVVALAADVPAHASLTELSLAYAPLDAPAALDAVVDAALARRLRRVGLSYCSLSPASTPALARLLSSNALTALQCNGSLLLDVPAARLLAAALRANATLTSLMLRSMGLWREPGAGTDLLGALTGHTSLRTLSLSFNAVNVDRQDEAGAVLGALFAANAPALTQLDIDSCFLDDDGLRPLFAALRRNTHLRALDCADIEISVWFAADVLLPAVRANKSLRKLFTSEE